MPELIQPAITGEVASQVKAPVQSQEPLVPEVVTQREFGDVPGTRQAIFDNVISALKTTFPISNDRYTLSLGGVKYRASRDYSNQEQKRAIMRGQTLGWNAVGAWTLTDNVTGQVVDKTSPRLIAKVPYLTNRGTIIFNGSEYTVASQMRLRPGVYTRVKDNGLIEAHFNVKGGTGPSFRVYMEPDSGIFRVQIGQATLKLYPVLHSMGISDRDLAAAWGKDLLHANVSAADPRAVQRAYTKLIPRAQREEEAADESLEKAAAFKRQKSDVNYVQYGVLQQCNDCGAFNGLNDCRRVQGFISPTGWCVLWQPAFGKFAQDAQANRVRAKFTGTIHCDDGAEKPWIYMSVHKGLCEAAYASLTEQDIECEPRFDKPHITVVKEDEVRDLIKKYGKKWKTACGDGRHITFSLQNAMVDLDPEGWKEMDRVWFLEVRSPELRAFRKSLGLAELPSGDDGEQPFHITVAVHKQSKKSRGTSALDVAFDETEEKTKAAFGTLDLLTKIAVRYLTKGVNLTKQSSCQDATDHEAKCHRCGDCCKIKVAVEGTTYQTSAACPFMSKDSNLCGVYENRFEVNPLCSPITALIKKGLAPAHCGYVSESYKTALAPVELKADSLVEQLVMDIYKEAGRYDEYKKAARITLPVSLTTVEPEPLLDEPVRGVLLAKLAAALDLSQPAEEAIEDEQPDVLMNRQSEAANVVADDPSGKQMQVKIDTERAERQPPTYRMTTESLKAVATKLINMGIAPPKLPAGFKGEEDDVKLAYEQFVSRFDRYAMGFVKQATVTDYGPKLREVFEKMELDEGTTESTLGQRSKMVSPGLIMDVTKKLINVNQGKAETDDRDALAYQRVLGPEDLFAERVARDAGGVGRRTLWRATFKGGVQHIPAGVLSPQLRSLLLKSGLAAPLEEVNPLEIFDQQVRVTRMGEGGMPSMDSVPDAARSVQPSHFGAIDPIRAPEGMKIGVDSRVTHHTYRGSDGQIYMDMINARSGKSERVGAQQLAKSVVAFPGELASGRPKLRAMVNSKQLGYVSPEQVDFELPHSSHMFTATSNLVPMVSSIKGGRLLMGAKMATQALPLRDAEAPLIQNAAEDGKSFEELYGERLGAVRATEAGQVEEITRDHIKVRYPSGSVKHDIYHQFPYNRKTFLHNTPMVTIGQQVAPGQLLAKSNYTNDKGQAALGKNLRVGYMAYRGFNSDDAIVISESAAKSLSSEHMYTTKYKQRENEETGRNAFLALFPGTFDKRQMAAIGDNGVVRPGTVVNQGDPLVLAVNKRQPKGRGVIRGRKNLFASAAETWDHSEQGVVTDVDKTRDGWKVFVKAYSAMNVGDKLANRYGGKGVVSAILPDDDMPQGADKQPLEILLNPLGVVSRVNPAQLIETALGKIARKTGKPYVVPGFTNENYIDFAKKELQRNGMSDTEDLLDPKTGRKIPKVFTGVTYMMKLHHMAEPKASGRDVGAYTAEGIPAGSGPEGSKRIGTGEMSALVSHGATNVIRDAKVVRGQRNDDYWRALRLGYPPPSPKIPVVYDKFMAYLQGAGINLRKSGDSTHLFAMTNADVDALSSGPITRADTVKGDTLDPIENGLFDAGKTGGHGGGRWSHIALAEPMPNPVMEEPLRRLLGLTKPQFNDVITGQGKVGNETGTRGILHALQRIKLDSAIEHYEDLMRKGKGSARDNAIKVVGYLRTMKKMGIKPEQLMMTKVPVLPPNFRPITAMGNIQMVSDPNYLYMDLMAANDDLKALSKDIGEGSVGDERLRLYQAFKAVTGLGDPVAVKTQETGVKGLLKHIFGDSPKYGMYQRRLLGAAVDTVGRGVITPNPSLNMDQVGLPENKAWILYRPFIIRQLVRRGMGAMDAARAIENKSELARKMLVDEMARRPVIINRAPVLHRYGMMAAWPMLTKGNTLQIPPLVTSGFNADFDGDAMNFHVPVSDDAVQDAVNKMLPSKNLRSVSDFDVHYYPRQEFLHGLHLASSTKNRRSHTFVSREAALTAYKRGDIGVGDKVIIAD